MTADPSFSVVMAAHNSERTIAQAIASVRLQTCESWELFVIDDGSGDDTVAIASSFHDHRIHVLRQPNRGPAAARNAGIERAQAPLVSTLDSDDLWHPRYLEVMAEALSQDRDASFAYTDAWVLDDPSGRIRRTTEMAYQRPPEPPPSTAPTFLEELIKRNFIYNSVTTRREALVAVGGYDERLWVSEDWELWLRLVATGHRGVRAPGILAIHRNHAGSLSSDAARMRRGDERVYSIVVHEWQTDDNVRDMAATACRARKSSLCPESRILRYPMSALRAASRPITARSQWYRQPPREVQGVLAAVVTALSAR